MTTRLIAVMIKAWSAELVLCPKQARSKAALLKWLVSIDPEVYYAAALGLAQENDWYHGARDAYARVMAPFFLDWSVAMIFSPSPSPSPSHSPSLSLSLLVCL